MVASPAMLEWLDVESVAWGRYHHAYGPATDVPDLLRALAVPSQAPKWIRRRAAKAKKPVLQHVVWALWGNLFHQGTVYAASAKAVPFLVAILKRSQSGDDQARQFIVEYLHHLACGYYADRFPASVNLAALEAACSSAESAGLPDAVFDGGAWNLIPDTAGPQVARDVAACWARDCYRAVEQAVPDLVQLTGRQPSRVVAHLLFALLAEFPRNAAAIDRLWADAAGKVTRPRTTAALLALALLANRGAAVARSRVHDAALQLGALATNRYSHLYTAAAEQLTGEDGALPSQRALDAVSTLGESDRACACPFADNLEQLGQAMLSRLPPSADTWVIDRLAERLRAAVGFSKLPSLQSLLVRGSPWRRPEPTPTQRQILRIIVEHGDWGRYVNVNQAEILRAMGLPADRERLSALAG